MVELETLFHISYGHSFELNRLVLTTPERGIPFVSRKMGDNGVAAYVEPVPGVVPNPAGELTCALSGNGVLTTHIQERPYYTAYHVACLRPKSPLPKQALLYYCLCIQRNRYRYSYGRQANRTLKHIRVPSTEQIPQWVHEANPDMFEGLDKPAAPTNPPELKLSTWRKFKISELFELKKGKRLTKAHMLAGNVPFIGSSTTTTVSQHSSVSERSIRGTH